jgi:hypothetical protein
MNILKKALFDEVRKNNNEVSLLTDDELNNMLFHHPEGLRLSLAGFIIVKRIFTAYSFEIPQTIKTRHHYGMGKIEYPYFFTRKRLVLFSEMDAAVIKLHGGVEGFLETCSKLE